MLTCSKIAFELGFTFKIFVFLLSSRCLAKPIIHPPLKILPNHLTFNLMCQYYSQATNPLIESDASGLLFWLYARTELLSLCSESD